MSFRRYLRSALLITLRLGARTSCGGGTAARQIACRGQLLSIRPIGGVYIFLEYVQANADVRFVRAAQCGLLATLHVEVDVRQKLRAEGFDVSI